MLPPRKHLQEENVDSWLMSYADMITLLLCFFIIFVSVSEPRKERLTAVTDGMAGKFGTVNFSTPLQGMYHSLQAIVEDHQLYIDVGIVKTDKGVELELSSNNFFTSGSAELREDKIQLLSQLLVTLKQVDSREYSIIVEGHTSDEPLVGTRYPSAWELTSAQASTVVRFLIEQGLKPEELSAVGYADSRPSVPNRDANGKAITVNRNKNQRITIKIQQKL